MKVRVNGIELGYEVAGAGDPVVLIGGSGMPAAAWQFSRAPALLAAGYQVVTFASRPTASQGTTDHGTARAGCSAKVPDPRPVSPGGGSLGVSGV